MKRIWVWVVIGSLMTPSLALAQGQQVSPKLVWVGLISALVGVGLIIHPDEQNVDVLDETYCVNTNYYNVEAGSCGSAMDRKVGAAMLGGGALLMWIGGREKKIKVTTNVTKTSKSASATIRWGK